MCNWSIAKISWLRCEFESFPKCPPLGTWVIRGNAEAYRRTAIVWYKAFLFQAASCMSARPVAAKVEFHAGSFPARVDHREQPGDTEPGGIRVSDCCGRPPHGVQRPRWILRRGTLLCRFWTEPR